MNQARATIDAGVCGFTTEVTAVSEDEQHVSFTVASPCDKVQALAESLPTVDAYTDVSLGSEGMVLAGARAHLLGCCAGCVVPSAVFKAMQVAAGLALPRPAHIDLVRL